MAIQIKKTAATIVVSVLLVGVVAAYWYWHRERGAENTAAEIETTMPAPGESNIVIPSSEKVRAVGIKTEEATIRPLQRTITVDGRIQYDDTRHVEVKLPSNGIIVDLKVKPGDHVQAGDVLAVASSPEIGQARATVLKLQMELEFQKEREAQVAEIRRGVMRVTEGIERNESLESLKQATLNTNLEEFHERLFGSYSKLILARKMVQELSRADESGALPLRTRTERLAAVEVAEASVNGAIELSRNESYLRLRETELATAQAQRQLDLARQHLRSLLALSKSKDIDIVSDDFAELALIELHAPFDGTVERRNFGVSERVNAGETVFIVADASQLWVAASIRELEWQALSLAPNQLIEIRIPALKSTSRTARIYYIGREVQSQNNSVPLIASIDNSNGELRPGLFVNVHLPIATEEVLTVPESAIMENEGVAFVFVDRGVANQGQRSFVHVDANRDNSGEPQRTFEKVDVKLGSRQNGLIEIVSGLEPGTPVVTRGAFFLKSELLLEQEE